MADQNPSTSGIQGILLSPSLRKANKTVLSKCIVCQKTQTGIALTDATNDGKATLKRAAQVRRDAGEDEGMD